MFLNKIQYITTSRINHHEPICHLKCWANIDLKVANPTDAELRWHWQTSEPKEELVM